METNHLYMHSAKPGFCAPPAERHQGREQYSTKLWRHKNEISKIMEFVRIFWKNNIQEAYLPKMSISRQIISEMLAGYTRKTPYKPF